MQHAERQVKEIICALKSLISQDRVTKYYGLNYIPYNVYVEALLPGLVIFGGGALGSDYI